jgi:feruloyl-CoA synthase
VSAFSIRTTADGSTIVESTEPLAPYTRCVGEALDGWAARTPDTVFLAEREATGAWSTLTYGAAHERVRTIGAGLLAAGASAEAPIGIVAENGIEHALVSLAAQYVGVPVSPMSVGYAGADADPSRLRDLLAKLAPAFVFANDERIGKRIAPFARVVSSANELAGDPTSADAAAVRVAGDTIAKIMFTSGSTGTPKGVITTHRMLSSNQTMLAAAWPEIAVEKPIVVDWLPWSHCFGGNHNFGLVLFNGGTLYVDGGRPMAGPFERTVANVREISPNVFFSVPRGYALLVERLVADAAFAAAFFSRLTLVCNAGASLPDPLREEIFRLAARHAGRAVRVTSSWGTTETAPLATTSWGTPEPDIDTIGTPVPGVEFKLSPTDGRSEIRVKGPNITPGYWRDPEATRAAFDDDGFYQTGDAASLKDPADPARGILFEGRLAENFKLSSGTWVNVGALRLALIERGAPLVEEVVIAGADRDSLAALVFFSRAHAATLAGLPDADHAELARHDAVRRFVAETLARHNAAAPASSTRVDVALLLPEPPNRGQGEITDKGTVNQRRALALRAEFVARLYARDGEHVVLPLTTVASI